MNAKNEPHAKRRTSKEVWGAEKDPGDSAYPAMVAINTKHMKNASNRMSMENARSLTKIEAFLIFYCIRKGL